MFVSESFFIDRIKFGLDLVSDSLTEGEEAFLISNIRDLDDSDFTAEVAKKLQERCSNALSEAYQENIANRKSSDWELKRNATIHIKQWREYNTNIYNESESILSGVVQIWYLGEGRALEKKAAGCLPVIAVTAAIISLILGVILNV